jgi:hypothetical protein
VVDNDPSGPRPDEMDWLDHVAETTVADAAFDEVRALYNVNPDLHLRGAGLNR